MKWWQFERLTERGIGHQEITNIETYLIPLPCCHMMMSQQNCLLDTGTSLVR